MTLYEKTLELINKDGVSLGELSKRTGISYDWLNKLKRGTIQDPSVNKIQKVYENLAKTPLFKQEVEAK